MAHSAARAAEATVTDTGFDVAWNAAWHVALSRVDSDPAECLAQCDLLRDSFANPFRPVSFDAAWLRWHDRCVVKMAQSIYDERRFDELPILADALEEAGCGNEEILKHCRQPAEHARGCWVVDAILGKR